MLKKIFIKGLAALLPVVVTFAVCIWVLRSLESFFGYWLTKILPSGTYFTGLGILVGIVLVFIVGILMHAWIINKLYEFGQRALRKIPLIKTIYNAISDVMGFLEDKGSSDKRAVIVELPHGRALGFVTADINGPVPKGLLKEDEYLVYVPLSYQIGGHTFSIAKDKVHPIDWTAEKTMSFVLTAGLAGKREEHKS